MFILSIAIGFLIGLLGLFYYFFGRMTPMVWAISWLVFLVTGILSAIFVYVSWHIIKFALEIVGTAALILIILGITCAAIETIFND